jgi:hypothetical protein
MVQANAAGLDAFTFADNINRMSDSKTALHHLTV